MTLLDAAPAAPRASLCPAGCRQRHPAGLDAAHAELEKDAA